MDKDFTAFGPWIKAMSLAAKIHEVTRGFPKDEHFGVTMQMRKAARSVAANIAEGFGRYTYPDKMHKYVQARGELIELMSDVYYSQHVGYITVEKREELMNDCREVQKLLNALIMKMQSLEKAS
jgi:four helix bundle protein